MSRIEPVSVLMPAFRAEKTVAASVKSVLGQTHERFEILVVSDDGTDYEAVLGRAGIADPRIRHFETGEVGAGSSAARNVGLDNARSRFCALLDADDLFAPEKLAIMLDGAQTHGLASCALAVTTPQGELLRKVGAGPDRLLAAGDYKFTNFSMDSMLVFDRDRADPRYDETQPCLTDLDFVLKLFAAIPACFHYGKPLHHYVKMGVSISNGPGVTERMVTMKRILLERLHDGHYRFADPGAGAGFTRFLEISLGAEQSFSPDPQAPLPVLFEDHLEPLLAP